MAGVMFEEKATKISEAIKINDVQGFRNALKNDEDPHHTDRKGNTYLHYVCTMHRPCIFHILMTTGIDVNAQNRHGNTALHVTALQNDCSHVGDLLAGGIDPSIRNKMGKTAVEIETKNKFWKTVHDKYQPGIFQAVEDHDVERVLYLLHCWTRVDCLRGRQTLRQFAASRKFHDLVFHLDKHQHTMGGIYAILEGDTEKAAQYLRHSKCNVNLLNFAAETSHILQHAVKAKDARQVRMICRAKANLNIRVTLECYLKAPLFFSAFHPDLPTDIMWTILRHLPDFTLRDERGRNAAVYALDKTDRKIPQEVIAFMISNGLDVSQRDETGVTLRDVARLARRKDILELIDKTYVKVIRLSNIKELKRLCIMGYDGMFINLNHRDTFIYASGNETKEALDFIQKLPKIQTQIRQLHHGICQWSRDRILQLITASEWPDILLNARDKGGRTALHLAILHWRMDLLKLFLFRDGIDTAAVTNIGRSAYHYACCVEEETEREQFCNILQEYGQNLTLPDYKGFRPQELIGRAESSLWIQQERKMRYGMEKQLQCVDKYEELCHMMKYRGKNLKHFEKLVCRFRYPLAQFHRILSPLMPEYRDLVLVALDKKKEDIATRLIQLGTDWTLLDWVNAAGGVSRQEKTLKVMRESEEERDGGMYNSERMEKKENNQRHVDGDMCAKAGEKYIKDGDTDAGQVDIKFSVQENDSSRVEKREDYKEEEELEQVTVEERVRRLGMLKVLAAIEKKKAFQEKKRRDALESRGIKNSRSSLMEIKEDREEDDIKRSYLSSIRKVSDSRAEIVRDANDVPTGKSRNDIHFSMESLEYESDTDGEVDIIRTINTNRPDMDEHDYDNKADNGYSDDEFYSDENSISHYDDSED